MTQHDAHVRHEIAEVIGYQVSRASATGSRPNLVAPVRLVLSLGGIAVGVPWGPVLAVVIVHLVGSGSWRVYQRPDLMEGWIFLSSVGCTFQASRRLNAARTSSKVEQSCESTFPL